MTTFLLNLFKNKTKPVSESTIKLYINNLTKLNDGNDIVNFDFIKDPKKVLQKLSKYKPTTIRTFIIAICSVLNGIPDKKELYNEYFKILEQLNSSLKTNNNKSDTQSENWINTEEISKIYDELKSKVSKKKAINKLEYDNILNLLLLSLYYNQPPRRNIDYLLMKISSNTDDTNYNYLDLDKKQFIFNNYKTAGTYNQIIIDISPQLMSDIILFLKNRNDVKKLKNKNYDIYFLVDSNGDNFKNSNVITKKLNNIFGKNVSSSLLRNIYLTNKYSKVINSLDDDVKQMGTSQDVALKNYIKFD